MHIIINGWLFGWLVGWLVSLFNGYQPVWAI